MPMRGLWGLVRSNSTTSDWNTTSPATCTHTPCALSLPCCESQRRKHHVACHVHVHQTPDRLSVWRA
eukprot:3822984-Rhodomonas_salina.1